jgi:hypothetical protein
LEQEKQVAPFGRNKEGKPFKKNAGRPGEKEKHPQCCGSNKLKNSIPLTLLYLRASTYRDTACLKYLK